MARQPIKGAREPLLYPVVVLILACVVISVGRSIGDLKLSIVPPNVAIFCGYLYLHHRPRPRRAAAVAPLACAATAYIAYDAGCEMVRFPALGALLTASCLVLGAITGYALLPSGEGRGPE